jgi:riboflavin biosynthesis pyrimidine reductase
MKNDERGIDPLIVAADKKKSSITVMINQVFPVKRQVPLDGLYLEQRLMDKAAEIGRSLVLTDFLTDKNGVIAKATKDGHFEIPAALKNASDWGRYQELMSQADVIISGGSYFKRLATAQDILYQFEPGNAFEKLGQWRLNAGYEKRSPDVAIVTRDLDFEIPEQLIQSGRRIVILTTDSIAISDEARSLSSLNTMIIGSGAERVEGGRMIATLANDIGYSVIMMVSGPRILDLLLKAERLDLIYLTEAQVEIPFEDPSTVQTFLSGGRKASDLKNFRLAHQFIQENVATEDASRISQSFLRYDREDLGELRLIHHKGHEEHKGLMR